MTGGGWWSTRTDRFISQRTDPLLSRIRTRLEAERLVLEAPGLSPLELSRTIPDGRCR